MGALPCEAWTWVFTHCPVCNLCPAEDLGRRERLSSLGSGTGAGWCPCMAWLLSIPWVSVQSSASFHLPEPLCPLASLEKKHPLGCFLGIWAFRTENGPRMHLSTWRGACTSLAIQERLSSSNPSGKGGTGLCDTKPRAVCWHSRLAEGPIPCRPVVTGFHEPGNSKVATAL